MKTRTASNIRFFFNFLLVIISVWFSILIKPHTLPFQYIENQSITLSGLIITWIIISLFFRKYKLGTRRDLRSVFPTILRINIIIGGVAALWMYGFRLLALSRFVLFGTLITATILEVVFYLIARQISHSRIIDDSPVRNLGAEHPKTAKVSPIDRPQAKQVQPGKNLISPHIRDYIIQEIGETAGKYIVDYINLDYERCSVLSTTTRFNVISLPDNCLTCITNLKRINDVRYINKFFSSVNQKLKIDGLFIGCVETKNQRKKRLLNKFPPVLNMIYYTFDYLLKRVAPKFNLTKRLYFFLTRGHNRVISKAETLGRLYSCGFEVEETRNINGMLYFIARKIRKPYFDPTPTYGPLIKLKRVGKGGKEFFVYKFRTMHPFSEYLQPYIYKHYQLKKGGKFKNDFRITTLGKFMRKFWIDELPMIINLLKGDMKIVGVRPLSTHYYNLYDDDLKKLRIQVKPGLVPPFYADMPKTLDEIQESERKYILAYQKHPFLTDWRYFWKAFINIVFKHARSE
ncbi:MAG: sugar transferase [Salinivirgaceae bacterium]